MVIVYQCVSSLDSGLLEGKDILFIFVFPAAGMVLAQKVPNNYYSKNKSTIE